MLIQCERAERPCVRMAESHRMKNRPFRTAKGFAEGAASGDEIPAPGDLTPLHGTHHNNMVEGDTFLAHARPPHTSTHACMPIPIERAFKRGRR